MIDSITGRIVQVRADHLVIETGGIAYRVFCPTRVLSELHRGEEAVIYVHLILRDDGIKLYGFQGEAEREIFRTLLPVGQIGPKLALQLLSSLSPQALVGAIANGDVERLTAVKGIGRKTAQRIVVELRDKLGGEFGVKINLAPLSQKEELAMRALTSKSLGFSPREARQALERLRDENLSVEELVRRALEIIGS